MSPVLTYFVVGLGQEVRVRFKKGDVSDGAV